MKKLIALSVVAVSLQGAVYAEADWRSVADAAVVAQDEELQKQAQKSAKQIVGAVDEFVSLAMKKIAVSSNKQDKESLKEILTQFEKLLDMYKVAFEEGDPNLMDTQAQQEFAQLAQELYMRCMPLRAVLAESKSLHVDGDLEKIIRVELFAGTKKMVAQINKDLK